MLKTYVKDPDSTIDYIFDFASLRNGTGFSDYLEYGEIITSVSATSSSDDLTITSVSKVKNDTAVKVWVSGGVLGSTYTLTARISTNAARTDDRSIKIFIDVL